MESRQARKPVVVAAFIFALFIALGLLVTRCDFVSQNTDPSLWNQLRRRIFDDDVPQNKSSSSKEYDMTGI